MADYDTRINWPQWYAQRIGEAGRPAGEDKLSWPCPLHHGRDRNFWVNTRNGCWKCESHCGGGNAVTFLMKLQGMDSAAALRQLRQEAGEAPAAAELSLAEYSREKHLPADFLRSLGVHEAVAHGVRCVAVPYYDKGRQQRALRWRFGAGGRQRFAWERGAEILPYGVWARANAEAARMVLVEGESDAQSLWYAGIPALGIPGATTFRSGWAAFLPQEVILHIEPDDGGRTFLRKTLRALGEAGYTGVVRRFSCAQLPGGCKDPSALLCAVGLERFRQLIAEALDSAQPAAEEDERPAAEKAAPAKLETYAACTLPQMALSPPRQIVEGMMAEGLGFLAGRQKLGKSWLALTLSLCVASGRPFLGKNTAQGDVLYLDMEGSPQRLQERIGAVWTGDIPPNLIVAHRTKETLAGGGLQQQLKGWAEGADSPTLIVIDTLGRVKGTARSRSLNAYEADTAIFSEVARMALDRHLAVMLVHHLRKEQSGDDLDSISGSLGLSGVADWFWLLDRARRGEESREARLLVDGRDICQSELALRWQAPGWQLMAEDVEKYRRERAYAESGFVTALKGMVAETGIWTGTPGQLSAELGVRGVVCTPVKVGIKLASFKQQMEEDGIVTATKRNGGTRLIEIRKVEHNLSHPTHPSQTHIE